MVFLRKLLFPFSIIYGGVTTVRNYLYNKGWLESREYDIPIICVGNLSTGGTGKSPMIEYLIDFLKEDYKIAVLSRGYKRKTSGYLEVSKSARAIDVGDEPLQFKKKFPKVLVVVCADRREGISRLKDNTEIILLDDAFQHRKVKASLNILLTPFNDLYIDDMVLPAGNLREPKCGSKRADIIIVTKCPHSVAYSKLQEIQYRLALSPNQKIYFSRIGYDENIYGKSECLPLEYLKNKKFTLVTGIAKPKPLIDYLKSKNLDFEHKKYADHHNFTSKEIENLKERELILTTEKDYVRLEPNLNKFAIYYLPIRTKILNNQDEFLKNRIIEAIQF